MLNAFNEGSFKQMMFHICKPEFVGRPKLTGFSTDEMSFEWFQSKETDLPKDGLAIPIRARFKRLAPKDCESAYSHVHYAVKVLDYHDVNKINVRFRRFLQLSIRPDGPLDQGYEQDWKSTLASFPHHLEHIFRFTMMCIWSGVTPSGGFSVSDDPMNGAAVGWMW